MTDQHLARRRMLETQIASRGVRDPEVLRALGRVPRHRFLEGALRDRAYGDHPLPIGYGQTISQPYIVALMTEALQLGGEEKVLEIGTGSGYQTAVLAEIAARVVSVERVAALYRRARELLDQLGYHNVVLLNADGTLGAPDHAPFDAILVTAGAPHVPERLLEQLAPDGKLVIPVGDRRAQVLVRLTRGPAGVVREELGEVTFVDLVGRDGWPAGEAPGE